MSYYSFLYIFALFIALTFNPLITTQLLSGNSSRYGTRNWTHPFQCDSNSIEPISLTIRSWPLSILSNWQTMRHTLTIAFGSKICLRVWQHAWSGTSVQFRSAEKNVCLGLSPHHWLDQERTACFNSLHINAMPERTYYAGKRRIKIERSVKMPWYSLSMGVARP